MLKDTIISTFNYDGTLLKWLKKVEKALQDDTLTNIEVVTNSDYSMQLKLTFGDGSFILSPSFTNKGRGIVTITKTATSGLVDTYTVTYTDNTTSTFTVTNAQGFNANNLYATLTAGTGIELTNDGQSVTVTAKNLLSDIVDANGDKRFIEGNLITRTIEGVSFTYAKYSLSGSHLMLVIAGSITNGTSLPAQQRLADVILPFYVGSKIVTVVGNIVTTASISCWGTNFTTQPLMLNIAKGAIDILALNVGEVFTATLDRTFRYQLDLLIDTD